MLYLSRFCDKDVESCLLPRLAIYYAWVEVPNSTTVSIYSATQKIWVSDAAQSVADDCGFGFMTGVRTMGKLSSSQLA